MRLIMQSAVSAQATFPGYMTTTAAHQYVLHDGALTEYTDRVIRSRTRAHPEYCRMEGQALCAINDKLTRLSVVDWDCVEGSCMLVSAAATIGDFQEARVHFSSLERMAKTMGVTTSSQLYTSPSEGQRGMTMHILIADVKAARRSYKLCGHTTLVAHSRRQDLLLLDCYHLRPGHLPQSKSSANPPGSEAALLFLRL